MTLAADLAPSGRCCRRVRSALVRSFVILSLFQFTPKQTLTVRDRLPSAPWPSTARGFITGRTWRLHSGVLSSADLASSDEFLTLFSARWGLRRADGRHSYPEWKIQPGPLAYSNLDYNWKGASMEKAVSLKISLEPTPFIHQYSSLLNANHQQK